MPQHCKKRPSTGSYPRRRLKCSTTTVTTDIVSKTNLVPSSNRRINTELAEPLRLPTHDCSDWHPLKYLQGVRSQLRQSQAEQLPSRPEKRMDQLSLPTPQTSTAVSALMTHWVLECVPAVIQRGAHVQGASSLWSFSEPLLVLPTQ